VRIFKTKEFARFARREGISDRALGDAIDRAKRGLIDADLGGHLIKQRVARPGQGSRGGYRTIIVWRAQQRCIFVYGFAKSRKADLTPDELKVYQDLGALLLGYDDEATKIAIAAKELVEVKHRG
jgi:hypothetical protein